MTAKERKFKNTLEKKMKELSKLRDDLRDLEAEVEQMHENASRAYDLLEEAVMTLSELV